MNLTVCYDPTAIALKGIEDITVSYCQMSWMKAEFQAASLVPSLKMTPAITSGSNVLPLSFRQWF